MGLIQCRRCKDCESYYDVSVIACNKCGGNTEPIVLAEAEEMSPEQAGTADDSVVAYVQKCSGCGALNFTKAGEEPVKICYKCNKTALIYHLT